MITSELSNFMNKKKFTPNMNTKTCKSSRITCNIGNSIWSGF